MIHISQKNRHRNLISVLLSCNKFIQKSFTKIRSQLLSYLANLGYMQADSKTTCSSKAKTKTKNIMRL